MWCREILAAFLGIATENTASGLRITALLLVEFLQEVLGFVPAKAADDLSGVELEHHAPARVDGVFVPAMPVAR